MQRDNFTEEVKAWAARVTSAVRSANPSLKAFRATVKYKFGLPQRIRLTFPRHYVFVEKGVGKGRKMGSGKETPKPAINPAIEANIEALADIAADNMADFAANRIFIR